MDGLGFIPTVQSASSKAHAEGEPVLIPVRRQKQRSRTTSFSRRALTLVSRSKSLFSTSSASSVDTSASVPACSPRSSNFSLSDTTDRHDRAFESIHARCDSTPSFCLSDPSEHSFPCSTQKQEIQEPHPTNRPESEEEESKIPFPEAASHEDSLELPRCSSHPKALDVRRSSDWMSALVDNEYASFEELTPPSSASFGGGADDEYERGCLVEPSRASSILERDMFPEESPMNLHFPTPGPLLPLRLPTSPTLLRPEDISALKNPDLRYSMLFPRLASDNTADSVRF